MVKRLSPQYFDENYDDYAAGWSADHMHYGFWFEDTKTHEESLVNTVREAAHHLRIAAEDRVLDAGCGTGGTCRYIAETFGAEITGITLSERLLLEAGRLSAGSAAARLIRYCMKDYADTGFPDRSFTKIIAIESVCHAGDKRAFLKEAYRLLEPGGRLLISDYFLVKNDLNEAERHRYMQWLEGWSMPGLGSRDFYAAAAADAGFGAVEYADKTPLVMASSRLMHDAGRERLADLLVSAGEGLVPRSRIDHNSALVRQKECLDDGIWEYGFFTADKNP